MKEEPAEKIYLGSWIMRPDLAIAEVMSKSGYFDWLAIDIEHTTITINQMEDIIRIVQASDIEAYVRLSENNSTLIKKVLDAGANGIIVPMVNTGDDVKKVIESCFYPPRGTRGVGLARAQNYGKNFYEYKNKLESQTKIIIQIEHIRAVNNIDEIFSVDGIFGYFIGPYDLSASLGKAGDFKDRTVLQALAVVKEAGRKYNIRAGYHIIEPDPLEIKEKKDEGYKIIGIAFDILFLQRGMELAFKKL